MKWHRHRGLVPRVAFYRDRAGLEVDLVVEAGGVMRAVEIKSGATIAGDFFDALDAFAQLRPGCERVVIHGGAVRQQRSQRLALPWKEVHTVVWA